MLTPRFYTLLTIIAAAALFRLLPHPDNVTPVAAMALFSGYFFSTWQVAVITPLLALLLSDLLLGFHGTLPFVYVAFVVTVFMGIWIRRYPGAFSIVAATIFSSVLFFLITNFGSWLLIGVYSREIDGLLQAYIAGVPFFRNTLLGNLFFSSMFFGVFYWMQGRWPYYLYDKSSL